MPLFIAAVVVFIIADILIRIIGKRMQETKLQRDREKILETSLRLDYSREAKTLKRAEVDKPKARILCVDDEEVILGSFRKILVLDGYSVDTVEKGQEALGLIQMHHYDFVFTDLKMPEMDGIEVTKSVKHIRPDIDVVIITGFATVETAVDCMKFGAMDYVQKPFTEDELLEFTKKILVKRQDRIQKQLKPKVSITHQAMDARPREGEFSIPGGVFIAPGHCWAALRQDGNVLVGIDDFAKKLIGRIDDIEFPNLGMKVTGGQTLFSIKQGNRLIRFHSPVSGKVTGINNAIRDEKDQLDITPYGRNWFCTIDADAIDAELPKMRIGAAAVALYQDDIERAKKFLAGIEYRSVEGPDEPLRVGEMEDLRDNDWEAACREFFA